MCSMRSSNCWRGSLYWSAWCATKSLTLPCAYPSSSMLCPTLASCPKTALCTWSTSSRRVSLRWVLSMRLLSCSASGASTSRSCTLTSSAQKFSSFQTGWSMSSSFTKSRWCGGRSGLERRTFSASSSSTFSASSPSGSPSCSPSGSPSAPPGAPSSLSSTGSAGGDGSSKWKVCASIIAVLAALTSFSRPAQSRSTRRTRAS
mmetsp:Transcript_3758/g.10807  ORF Transcript_3758/g.10807 Transcript_3758/m.10807 type:complete len:203 (-) Transcript_3758:389-997(-)